MYNCANKPEYRSQRNRREREQLTSFEMSLKSRTTVKNRMKKCMNMWLNLRMDLTGRIKAAYIFEMSLNYRATAEEVTWCFMRSHPLQLYQSKTAEEAGKMINRSVEKQYDSQENCNGTVLILINCYSCFR